MMYSGRVHAWRWWWMWSDLGVVKYASNVAKLPRTGMLLQKAVLITPSADASVCPPKFAGLSSHWTDWVMVVHMMCSLSFVTYSIKAFLVNWFCQAQATAWDNLVLLYYGTALLNSADLLRGVINMLVELLLVFLYFNMLKAECIIL